MELCEDCGLPLASAGAPPPACRSRGTDVYDDLDCERRAKERALAKVASLRAKFARVRAACVATQPHLAGCDRPQHDDGDCQCGAWVRENMGVEILALLEGK